MSLVPGAATAPPAPARRRRQALGWQHDEIPRWMQYPEGAGVGRGPAPEHDRDLPPPGRGCRAPDSSTGCRVERLVLTEGCRVGPRTTVRPTARARRDPVPHVFVCGGAIQTPALLQRSGTAPPHRWQPRRPPDRQAGGALRRRDQRARRRSRAPGQGVRPGPLVRRVGEQPGPGGVGAERQLAHVRAGGRGLAIDGGLLRGDHERGPRSGAGRAGLPRSRRDVPADPPRTGNCSAAGWHGSPT